MKVIKKAKIINDSYLEVEYEEIGFENDQKFTNTLRFTGGQRVHPDLKTAFSSLIPYMVDSCELMDFTDALVEVNIIRYSVTGFSIGGSDEHEGATLIGRKTLLSKKVLNLCAPFTKYDPEVSDYEYSSELKAAVALASVEVAAYLEGKHEPSQQTKLELA
jgi:hypothetical protein